MPNDPPVLLKAGAPSSRRKKTQGPPYGEPCAKEIPAATYSPRQLPTKYHRRCSA